MFGRPNYTSPDRKVSLMDLVERHADLCPPANEVFTPEELDERIAMHSARILPEVHRIDRDSRKRTVRKIKLEKRILLPTWARVCNCCVCRKLMVARQQPERPLKVSKRYSDALKATAKVAGYIGDRPVCAMCLPVSQEKAA